ncbi:hypothetical protein MYA_5299 [Burkholderia sp. KJ006]|nr:hypothetical protein MYA_5299 [Burkholderia sp. KJ006]
MTIPFELRAAREPRPPRASPKGGKRCQPNPRHSSAPRGPPCRPSAATRK